MAGKSKPIDKRKIKYLKIRIEERVYNEFKEVCASDEDNNNMSRELMKHIRKRIKEYKVKNNLFT